MCQQTESDHGLGDPCVHGVRGWRGRTFVGQRMIASNIYMCMCVCVYVNTHKHTGISTTSGPPSRSAREGCKMRSLVLFSCECSGCLSVLICVAIHVHMNVCGIYMWYVCMCLLGTHAQPCCLLDLGAWSFGNLMSAGLPDLVAPNK